MGDHEPVTLNVGGVIYMTTRSTLVKYPDSMLGAMFSGSFQTPCDNLGQCLADVTTADIF